MKFDLATSIVAAVVGVFAAYLVTNLLLPSYDDVRFKVIDASKSYALDEPNEEVFNYRALNPTVEVYVGECDEYDENYQCIDNKNPEEPTEEE